MTSEERAQKEAYIATERELQLTTARANQTTDLTNCTAANWAPEVAFSPFVPFSRRQLVLQRSILVPEHKQTNAPIAISKSAPKWSKRSWFDKRLRNFLGFLVKRHTSEDFHVFQYFFLPMFAALPCKW